jgi:tetratricopeptide (TPR) repeat protein
MGRYSLIGALAALAVAAVGCPPPTALDRAYTLHTSWLDSGDREALEQAAAAYGEHVTGCPGTENCFEAFRRLGDLLMELDRHQEAAQAYRRSAEIAATVDDAVSAARAQVSALEGWLGVPPQGMGTTRWSAGPPLIDSDRPPTPADQPQHVSPPERMLVEAADLLLELDPSLHDRTGVRYQTAFLLYQRRHYDDASDRWRQMAELDPGAAEILSAMRILLPTHHAREAWADLVRDGSFFLELPGLPLDAAERVNLQTMIDEARAR